MKIHFSNVNFSSSSGPNSFAHRLASELATREYEIVSHNSEYDIFLCFIEPSSMPKRNCKFIHRLDGIWFKPEEYHTNNRNIKWAYDNAHHVIWQTNFDKQMTNKWWGDRKGSVIYNGIALEDKIDLEKNVIELKNKFNKIFICAASWHRQKRLKENIEFFKLNSSKNDALIVLGSNPDFVVKDENIFYMGHLTHRQCLQLYEISDYFIHLSWLDHCPNVVVEALSRNCTVICTDSGGTKEIVKNGIIIPEKTKYNFELCDYDNPPELELKKINLPINMEIDKKDLCIKKVADKYESVFK